MNIFSLYNSLPGLANMAGQAWNAGAGAVQDAFTPREDEQPERDPRIQENALRQQRNRGRSYTPSMNPIAQDFATAMGPAAQARTLGGMANTAMAAHAKEMDARRSSFREARRLAHERDMLLLRLQAEREMRGG